MLHVTSAGCVAHDLHTIAPGPLERTFWSSWRSEEIVEHLKLRLWLWLFILLLLLFTTTTTITCAGFRIRFTVVSEPLEDDPDADCEDVGVAYVSVRDILKTQKDIKEKDIDSEWQSLVLTCIGSASLCMVQTVVGWLIACLMFQQQAVCISGMDLPWLLVHAATVNGKLQIKVSVSPGSSILNHCLFCWLLNVPATCRCISDKFTCCHRDGSRRSNFPSHPVTVYWHWADQSQHWPYNARHLAG